MESGCAVEGEGRSVCRPSGPRGSPAAAPSKATAACWPLSLLHLLLAPFWLRPSLSFSSAAFLPQSLPFVPLMTPDPLSLPLLFL